MHNKYKKCHANKLSEFVWPYMFLKNKTFATIAKMVVVFFKNTAAKHEANSVSSDSNQITDMMSILVLIHTQD